MILFTKAKYRHGALAFGFIGLLEGKHYPASTKAKGINTQWKDIVRTMNIQKLVTTNLTNEFDQPFIIRQCSEPIEADAKIYEALKFKHKPFTRKKAKSPRRNSKKLKIKPSMDL